MTNKIRVIAFDADDTLWVNENYFRDAEIEFCTLLSDVQSNEKVMATLFETEIANLKLYGYGIKGFMLSMIETIYKICGDQIKPEVIKNAIDIGQNMFLKPIELLDGVEEILQSLYGKYRLVVATKGDLLDQERKLQRSGLDHYFHHIEIMSDKQEKDYQKLLKHLDCPADEFLMIGNSLKSDVLPVLAIGGHAIHVPYHITWFHEQVEEEIAHPNFHKLEDLRKVLLKLMPLN